MKGILAAIVVLALAGGGYWFYTQQSSTALTPEQAETAANPTAIDPDGDGDTHDAMTGGMETGTVDAAATATTTTTTTTTTSTGTIKEFTVDGSNFKFAPATMSVKKGDTVKITFRNTGGFHDLKIDEFKVATKQIQGGASEVITFVADKAGTFEYYCSVGNHRAMGMKGTLTVQ
jgi:plastocyanin